MWNNNIGFKGGSEGGGPKRGGLKDWGPRGWVEGQGGEGVSDFQCPRWLDGSPRDYNTTLRQR